MWRSASGVKMTSTKDHSGLRAPRRDLNAFKHRVGRHVFSGVG